MSHDNIKNDSVLLLICSQFREKAREFSSIVISADLQSAFEVCIREIIILLKLCSMIMHVCCSQQRNNRCSAAVGQSLVELVSGFATVFTVTITRVLAYS